jgi:hypothetical protein
VIGRVQPGQHLLQDMAVEGRILWHTRAHVLEFRFLLEAADGHAPLAVAGDALFQRRVVERATAPQDALKRALLGGRRLELLLVGRAHRLSHSYTARLRRWRAMYSRTARTTSLLMERSFSAAICLMVSATWRGKRMVMRVSSRSLLMVTLYHHQRRSARAKALRLAAGYFSHLRRQARHRARRRRARPGQGQRRHRGWCGAGPGR